jgi:hypothetical protein
VTLSCSRTNVDQVVDGKTVSGNESVLRAVAVPGRRGAGCSIRPKVLEYKRMYMREHTVRITLVALALQNTSDF